MSNINPDSESHVSRDLVGRIISGEAKALNEMANRYGRWLITLLTNRCRDRYLAEDIAQETWVIVLTKVPKGDLRDHSKLRAFIKNIAVNQLTMAYRKTTRRREDSDAALATTSDPSFSPEQLLTNKQLGEVIDDMLNDMSTQRDAIFLKERYLLGTSKQEICARYQQTGAQFDRILHRARQRFIKLWAEKYPTERPLS